MTADSILPSQWPQNYSNGLRLDTVFHMPPPEIPTYEEDFDYSIFDFTAGQTLRENDTQQMNLNGAEFYRNENIAGYTGANYDNLVINNGDEYVNGYEGCYGDEYSNEHGIEDQTHFYAPERFGSVRQMNLSATHCKLLEVIWRELRVEKLKQLKKLNAKLAKNQGAASAGSKLAKNLAGSSARSTKDQVIKRRDSPAKIDKKRFQERKAPATRHPPSNYVSGIISVRHSFSDSETPHPLGNEPFVVVSDALLTKIIFEFVDSSIGKLSSCAFRAQFAEHCRRFGRHVAAVFRGTVSPRSSSLVEFSTADNEDYGSNYMRTENPSTQKIRTNPSFAIYNTSRSHSAPACRERELLGQSRRNHLTNPVNRQNFAKRMGCDQAWSHPDRRDSSSVIITDPIRSPTPAAAGTTTIIVKPNGSWTRQGQLMDPSNLRDSRDLGEKKNLKEFRDNSKDSLVTRILADPSLKSETQSHDLPSVRMRRGRSVGLENYFERAGNMDRRLQNSLATPLKFVPPRNCEKYRALYSYEPQHEDELSLQEEDLIYVVRKCDDGWFIGTQERTGQFGTFPGNYAVHVESSIS